MNSRNGPPLESLQAEHEALRRQLGESAQTPLGDVSVSGWSDLTGRTIGSDPLPGSSPYASFLDDLLRGLATLSPTGKIIRANTRLAQLLGTSPESLADQPLANALPAAMQDELGRWLRQACNQAVQASRQIALRTGEVRHLHFRLHKLPNRDDAALSLVVTDLARRFDPRLIQAVSQEINDVNQSLMQARAQALDLLQSAIAAHSRADAIQDELQREISHRKRAEAALQDSEQRYRRMMDAIGSVQWLSTADWETVLYIDPVTD